MNSIKNIFLANPQIAIYLLALIVVTICGIAILPNKTTFLKEENFQEQQDVFLQEDDGFEDKLIYVHIDGAVLNPGIEEVKEGTRIFELIELSGGLTEDADISRINLASVLKDEQKIIVPQLVDESLSDTVLYKVSNNTSFSGLPITTKTVFPININYATSSELQALTGIRSINGTKNN